MGNRPEQKLQSIADVLSRMRRERIQVGVQIDVERLKAYLEKIEHVAPAHGVTGVKAQINPWIPISDLRTLKYLGKLAEEAGELSAAISRCIIQGLDEREPVTGKINREWLEDELADVAANCCLVIDALGLDHARMKARRDAKMTRLKVWHEQLGGEAAASATARPRSCAEPTGRTARRTGK